MLTASEATLRVEEGGHGRVRTGAGETHGRALGFYLIGAAEGLVVDGAIAGATEGAGEFLLVGADDGAAVGPADEESLADGAAVGRRVGTVLGAADGLSDGDAVGRRDGTVLGAKVGRGVGDSVGEDEGLRVGDCVGAVGLMVGFWVGMALGDGEGRADGFNDGVAVGADGAVVGATDGFVVEAMLGRSEGLAVVAAGNTDASRDVMVSVAVAVLPGGEAAPTTTTATVNDNRLNFIALVCFISTEIDQWASSYSKLVAYGLNFV